MFETLKNTFKTEGCDKRTKKQASQLAHLSRRLHSPLIHYDGLKSLVLVYLNASTRISTTRSTYKQTGRKCSYMVLLSQSLLSGQTLVQKQFLFSTNGNIITGCIRMQYLISLSKLLGWLAQFSRLHIFACTRLCAHSFSSKYQYFISLSSCTSGMCLICILHVIYLATWHWY